MLRAQVPGLPGHDNALLVTADSGQARTVLLLDCAAGVLGGLPIWEITDTGYLRFSHFQMDHIAGFGQFFRVNFDRTDRENHLWGAPGAVAVLGHRLAGYLRNLASELRGVWHVYELHGAAVRTACCSGRRKSKFRRWPFRITA